MPLQILPDDQPTPASLANQAQSGEELHSAGRRRFLAGLATSGAALALGGRPRIATAEDPSEWYALVSDIHIAADASTRLRGEVMADNLRAVVSDILAASDAPRAVLFDGDIALNEGLTADYRTVASLLEPLRKAKLPIHLGLGNHDERGRFREALKETVPTDSQVVDKQVAALDEPGMRFLVLDSLDQVKLVPGRLGQTQLDWLAKTLDAKPDQPTLVFLHHNPIPIQKPGLLDTEAFLEVVRPRRQVKGIVFGHTHVWGIEKDDDLYMINLPAVAYSFAQSQPLGWCRLRPTPGGAELELRCVAGNREADRKRIDLKWRTA